MWISQELPSFTNLEKFRVNKQKISVSDPDWIRIQSGYWIRIRIQEGKNDPQKYKFFL
jgi:hypothetical protein